MTIDTATTIKNINPGLLHGPNEKAERDLATYFFAHSFS